ncbi:site-specific integrase [Rhizobium pisi]|uniref:site-specific integrase n=1 Tax=Rhizobium pisi TaxID=574561 RepID=UPI00103DE422|nr:site-specific integrase [Rhizobium pisi]TCA48560.1 site-specific integrase [Rhizobium pisi]
MTKATALFLTEGELADRMGVKLDLLKTALPGLAKSGFPAPDPLFGGRRYWPACEAFLAQALQFELTLRQIDVIGRWEKTDEPLAGGIVDRGQRWRDGLGWSHLDANGILLKETSKVEGVTAEHDTMQYPFLREIIDMFPPEKRFGPMIKSEATGLPYRYRHFSKVWRDIANEAGVPAHVWNRDSRAGGVTEGSDAGANLEHLRHHANHKNIATTARYNRQTLEKTQTVAKLRVAHRGAQNGQGTGE